MSDFPSAEQQARDGQPSSEEIDSELTLAIMGYDPRDKYPEWSNSAMREAYRAGWEDGNAAGVDIERDEQAAERDRLAAEVSRLRAQETRIRELCRDTGEFQARAKHLHAGSARLLAVEILAALDTEGEDQ